MSPLPVPLPPSSEDGPVHEAAVSGAETHQESDPGQPDGESDARAAAMRSALSADAAAWSAARAQETGLVTVAPASATPAKPAAPRATRAKPKAPVDTKPVPPAPRAPFKMSYDGTTEKDYIAHIIRLGAR